MGPVQVNLAFSDMTSSFTKQNKKIQTESMAVLRNQADLFFFVEAPPLPSQRSREVNIRGHLGWIRIRGSFTVGSNS